MDQHLAAGNGTVIFIANSLHQPRIIKRIASLHNGGFNVVVYGYSRQSYQCNAVTDSIPVTLLGQQKDGTDYISKLVDYKKDIDKIVATHGKQPIYYCTSVFAATLLRHKGVKYVYEVSDILYGYPKFRPVEPLLKWIDKKNIKKSALTVMTSQGFADYFFGNKQQPNVLVQPNKLGSYFKDKNREAIEPASKLRFAFVGAIRYKNTVLRFAEVIGKHYPKHEFHFYGEGIMSDDAKELAQKYSNVFYHGPYKNPDNIESIYANVDVVMAAYETSSKNELIAEPNKLYEAMFFCKPIIVSKGTFLESRVKQLNCGFAIDSGNDSSIIDFLDELKSDQIKEMSAYLKTLNPSELIDNPSDILERIGQINQTSQA